MLETFVIAFTLNIDVFAYSSGFGMGMFRMRNIFVSSLIQGLLRCVVPLLGCILGVCILPACGGVYVQIGAAILIAIGANRIRKVRAGIFGTFGGNTLLPGSGLEAFFAGISLGLVYNQIFLFIFVFVLVSALMCLAASRFGRFSDIYVQAGLVTGIIITATGVFNFFGLI